MDDLLDSFQALNFSCYVLAESHSKEKKHKLFLQTGMLFSFSNLKLQITVLYSDSCNLGIFHIRKFSGIYAYIFLYEITHKVFDQKFLKM